MPPALSAEEIRDVNTRYHDVAAHHYDSKWGIDFGEIGREQVLAKVDKALGHRPDGWRRSLEIGAGTGYFTLNLLRAGMIGEATCSDISPGMLTTLRANAERLGLEVRTEQVDAERLPFADESFDLVLGHAVLHHIPDLERAFAEFARVLAPGGTVLFAGEPSRYGDRLARVPKRAAGALAPLWRRALGARAAAPHDEQVPDAALEGFVDVHAFAPGELARAARSAGFADVRVTRRGAAGQLVRLDQSHARGDGRARGRAVGVAPVRLPRLPAAAGPRSQVARVAPAAGDLLQPADRRAQAAHRLSGRSGRRPRRRSRDARALHRPPQPPRSGRLDSRTAGSGHARAGARGFPLFPLGIVALPSESVPLHIFEDRYKRMIERCLSADQGSWSASSGSSGSRTRSSRRSAARARSSACSSAWTTGA